MSYKITVANGTTKLVDGVKALHATLVDLKSQGMTVANIDRA